MRIEVNEYIAQYAYRKEFGLSWAEFNDEPYRIYIMNLLIRAIIKQREEKQSKYGH